MRRRSEHDQEGMCRAIAKGVRKYIRHDRDKLLPAAAPGEHLAFLGQRQRVLHCASQTQMEPEMRRDRTNPSNARSGNIARMGSRQGERQAGRGALTSAFDVLDDPLHLNHVRHRPAEIQATRKRVRTDILSGKLPRLKESDLGTCAAEGDTQQMDKESTARERRTEASEARIGAREQATPRRTDA